MITSFKIFELNTNERYFYHGTGEVTKVKHALENNTFKPFISGGVPMGMYMTPNKKLATDYANETNGNDKGVITLSFKRPPKLKLFKSAKEEYEYQTSFSKITQQESITLFKEHLLSQNYDGFMVRDDVVLIFDEKMNILNETSLKPIKEEKEIDGMYINTYDEVLKDLPNWAKSDGFKLMKPDDVLIEVINKEQDGRLRAKFKLKKIKFKRFGYSYHDYIINKNDLKMLLKKEKIHKVNSFDKITKIDLNKIMVNLTNSFQSSWTPRESIDNCYDKLSRNYPIGFKNIPNIINLYRYLDAGDESKIKQHRLGVHYVTDKSVINHEFLYSINVDEEHNGFIVEIETTKNQIDVNETIVNNLYFPDENEITLKENATYKVIKIERFKP